MCKGSSDLGTEVGFQNRKAHAGCTPILVQGGEQVVLRTTCGKYHELPTSPVLHDGDKLLDAEFGTVHGIPGAFGFLSASKVKRPPIAAWTLGNVGRISVRTSMPPPERRIRNAPLRSRSDRFVVQFLPTECNISCIAPMFFLWSCLWLNRLCAYIWMLLRSQSLARHRKTFTTSSTGTENALASKTANEGKHWDRACMAWTAGTEGGAYALIMG